VVDLNACQEITNAKTAGGAGDWILSPASRPVEWKATEGDGLPHDFGMLIS